MQESKQDRRPDKSTPDSDATSKDTLEDVEKSEKSSAGNQDERSDSSGPSPDGALDDQKKTDDAGPM